MVMKRGRTVEILSAKNHSFFFFLGLLAILHLLAVSPRISLHGLLIDKSGGWREMDRFMYYFCFPITATVAFTFSSAFSLPSGDSPSRFANLMLNQVKQFPTIHCILLPLLTCTEIPFNNPFISRERLLSRLYFQTKI